MPAAPKLDSGPIEYGSLADVVAARLRDAILAGRLSDGDHIVERDIAAELQVSRGPIRDALRQLEREGLVVLLPRRGARVATLTPDEALEVIALRQAVEPVAVRFLIERGEPALLEPLEACVERLRAAARSDDWSALVLLDMAFHEEIYRQAGRRHLLRIWESLRAPLLQTFRIHREFYDSGEAVHRSHRTLLDEIASFDLERAQRAVAAHVVDLRPQLLRKFARE